MPAQVTLEQVHAAVTEWSIESNCQYAASTLLLRMRMSNLFAPTSPAEGGEPIDCCPGGEGPPTSSEEAWRKAPGRGDATTKRLRMAVNTIEGYGHFREHQDGFRCLRILDEYVKSLEASPAPSAEVERLKARVAELEGELLMTGTNLEGSRRRASEWGDLNDQQSQLIATLTRERDEARAERDKLDAKCEGAEDALRSLACWLGVGGYNAPEVDAKVFEQKIRDGVDMVVKAESARARGPQISESEEMALLRRVNASLQQQVAERDERLRQILDYCNSSERSRHLCGDHKGAEGFAHVRAKMASLADMAASIDTLQEPPKANTSGECVAERNVGEEPCGVVQWVREHDRNCWHYYENGDMKPAVCGRAPISGMPLVSKTVPKGMVCMECFNSPPAAEQPPEKTAYGAHHHRVECECEMCNPKKPPVDLDRLGQRVSAVEWRLNQPQGESNGKDD